MASRSTISMNFESAKRKAEELDNVAANLESLAKNNMEANMNELSSAWTGENANKFIDKGKALTNQMLNSASDLRKTADTIRTVAKNIYDAEMEALRIAEEQERALTSV